MSRQRRSVHRRDAICPTPERRDRQHWRPLQGTKRRTQTCSCGANLRCLIRSANGGAGNRTPVRASIRNHVYVRMRRLVSPPAGATPPNCRTIFLNLTQRAEATRYASPTLRYSGAASGGLPPEQVREAEAYAAIARLELAVKSSQHFLPGHRGPGHAAISSLDPSKPIAPSSK